MHGASESSENQAGRGDGRQGATTIISSDQSR